MFSPCVLLIDPDVNLLAGLERVLSRAGYRVLTAHDRRQGLSLAQAALPEVIVCDETTPSQNDFDMKSTLALDPRTAPIPVIFLSKPFDQEEVVANVNEVIRGRQRNNPKLRTPATS